MPLNVERDLLEEVYIFQNRFITIERNFFQQRPFLFILIVTQLERERISTNTILWLTVVLRLRCVSRFNAQWFQLSRFLGGTRFLSEISDLRWIVNDKFDNNTGHRQEHVYEKIIEIVP